MKEQQAIHTLRAHRPVAQTQGASGHHVATSSGMHPEDRSRMTDTRRPTNKQPLYEEEDDDDLYPSRLPSSARRYFSVPATTPPRTVMRVTRHHGLPPRQQAAHSHTHAPGYEEPGQMSLSWRRGRLHPSVYIGLAMLTMLIGWIALSSFTQWWQVQQDTWHYGTPRTFQIDADVKHGGRSHFTIENLNGHVVIYELVVTNMEKPHLYLGPVLSGAGAELQPATLSFADLNGDGYPDMVITIDNGRYLLINDHSAFRPVTASDHITALGGVEMADAERTNAGTMLLVLCEKRHVETILHEFEDWNEQEGLGVKVLLYGITQKAHDGFLLLALNAPLPEGVYTNLVMDDDIVDYIQYSPFIPILPPPA